MPLWHNTLMKSIEKIINESSEENKETLKNFVSSFANSIRENKDLQQKIDYLTQDIGLLKKKLFGSSSEKSDALSSAVTQDGIFDEFELCMQESSLNEALPNEEDGSGRAAPAPKKKSNGRKPLPSHLKRRIVTHDISDEEKQCGCGFQMDCISDDVSEQLEYKPAELIVIENHCKKYTCSSCSKKNKTNPEIKPLFITAKKPPQIVPKSD